MPAIDVFLLNHSMTILPYSNSGSPRVKRDGKCEAKDCLCLSFLTGDGRGRLEIDDEYEFSYELDILDMYQRAAARSAPLSKDFCASLAQADCWEDWGTDMVAALRAPADDLADCAASERVTSYFVQLPFKLDGEDLAFNRARQETNRC